MGGCLAVLSGRLRSFPLGFRAGPIWILRGSPAMFLYALFYDRVRNRKHVIHKSRKAFVLG